MRSFAPYQRPALGNWRPTLSGPQAHGLVGWWPMQDTSVLLSGLGGSYPIVMGQPGSTPQPPPQQPSEIGLMPTFVGTAGSAVGDVGTVSAFSFSGSITVSAWIVPNVTATGYVVSHRSSGAGETGDFYLGVLSTRKMFFGIYAGGAFRGGASGTLAMTNGSLYHVLGTFDDPNDTYTYYINGVRDFQGSITQAFVGADLPLHIGFSRIAITPQELFKGAAADIRIYNRAFDAKDVWELYDPSTRWALYDAPMPAVAPPALFTPFGKGQAQPPLLRPPRVVSYGSHVR